MSHFLKNIADLEDILCQMIEFCVLSEIHVSETRFKQINENLRLNKQLRKIGRFTHKFSSFAVKLSLLASIILHMICYRAFSF